MLNREPIFDEVRRMLGRGFARSEVARLDEAIDHALNQTAPPPRQLGLAGKALIRKWEGCAKRRSDGRFEAYADPGSADGTPWTIGWGSTGPDIRKGVIWTQAECDARFDRDILKYVNEVAQALGDAPTTPNQFDALVSFHYNTGAIDRASLTRLHRQGRFAEAQGEFGKWIYNNGRVIPGLENRRSKEATLYGKE